MLGREEMNLLRKAVKALEQGAEAQAKLLALAEKDNVQIQAELESGPSICPHCGKLNPTVTQLGGNEGPLSGPIDEYIMRAETHCCDKQVYCIPDGWTVLLDPDEALDLLKQKGGEV